MNVVFSIVFLIALAGALYVIGSRKFPNTTKTIVGGLAGGIALVWAAISGVFDKVF